jgi:hypothetical protein
VGGGRGWCLAQLGGTPAAAVSSFAAACAALVELLDLPHALFQPAEFCAAAALLLAAVRCQPGLAERLLFPPGAPTPPGKSFLG